MTMISVTKDICSGMLQGMMLLGFCQGGTSDYNKDIALFNKNNYHHHITVIGHNALLAA